MKKYVYKKKEYASLWELRGVLANVVFPDDADEELLKGIGVKVKDVPDTEPDPETVAKEELAMQVAIIDSETSTAITSGFDYEINGVTYHFNYDSFDQQNFADTANACIMIKSGVEGFPDTVTWNGYDADGALVRITLSPDEFLALYMKGALTHKAACMEEGGQKKAALKAGK